MKSTLEKLAEPSSERPRSVAALVRICAVIWCAGSLIPLAAINHAARFGLLEWAAVATLWAGTLLLLIGEALLTAALLAVAKGYAQRTRGARKVVVTALPVLGLGILLWVTLASWIFGAVRIGFLTAGSVVSYLLDVPSILPFINRTECVVLLATLVWSLGLITALFAKARPAGLQQGGKLLRWAGIALVSAFLCWRVFPAVFLSRGEAKRMRGIVEARLLPTVTLVWAPVMFAGAGEDTVTLPLARRYDLQTYAERIDRSRERPNVLVFVIEALRADALHAVVNGQTVMPTVSKLATEGVEFTRAYSPGNESAYSMASILTGLHPLIRPSRYAFAKIDYPLLRLSDVLSPVYRTGFFSSSNEDWQHMKNFSLSSHLDRFLDAGSYSGSSIPPDAADLGAYQAYQSGRLSTGTLDDSATVGEMQSWITSMLDSGDRRPVYAMASLQTSHYPYEQGNKVPAVFQPDTFSETERAQFSFVTYPPWATERMRNRYWNSLRYIDGLIGGTVEMLKSRQALDNTIIVVTGDHGELFREFGEVTHAGRLRELTIRVAFVLWSRALTPHRYECPVSLVDLAPTIVELTHMPEHAGFQGYSLFSRADTPRRPVFATTQNLAYEDTVIVSNWKYLAQADGAYEMLFDLAADPEEQTSLIETQPVVAACLRETLNSFRHNQLAYYAAPKLRNSDWQPRHELPSSEACQSAFAH